MKSYSSVRMLSMLLVGLFCFAALTTTARLLAFS